MSNLDATTQCQRHVNPRSTVDIVAIDVDLGDHIGQQRLTNSRPEADVCVTHNTRIP